MDPPQREVSSGLADAIDRERLGRLVASRKAPQPTSTISGRSKSKWVPLPLILTISFLALVASGLLLYALFRVSSSKSNANTSQSNSRRSYPPVSVKHEMIAIPGGTFKMGRDDGPPQERPSHNVVVRDFLLDNTEVARAEYAVFVKETNHPAPDDWAASDLDPEKGQLAVINVSFEDAEAFASWRSKRDGVPYCLPTEEEWEYAAKNGGRITLYPWGNEWMDNHAATKRAEVAGPLPVGSFPEGRNQWGVYDLIGNVWEWTSSRASLYPGYKVEIPAATRDWIISREGSYASDPNDRQFPISATYRDWFSPTFKRYCQLNFMKEQNYQVRQDESTSGHVVD